MHGVVGWGEGCFIIIGQLGLDYLFIFMSGERNDKMCRNDER